MGRNGMGKAPDGYDETLAIVKAIRAFVDVAKDRAGDNYAERHRIENRGHDAMKALWLVYGVDR